MRENETKKSGGESRFSNFLFEMPLGPPSGYFKTGLGLGLLDPYLNETFLNHCDRSSNCVEIHR